MSHVIWKNFITPNSSSDESEELFDPSFKDSLPNTLKVPIESQSIVLKDPRAFRSMSRAALLLSHICTGIEETVLKPYLLKNPFSVGIYCAVENGPIDAPTTLKMLDASPEQFAEMYRKLRNPKMYLKQLPNLVPAQLGIFLNIQGIMNVYTHSEQGGIQALEQAEIDLQQGVVEAALVCTAHAFDDYLVVKRSQLKHPERRLCEGAAAMVLVRDHKSALTPWSDLLKENKKNNYGVSDQIINLLID